ncbi:MAG: FixH family protein [Candidatus Koribacter versatilis]|uniref:FixH family protein n=1 Tax=Candidatus Korobacter versatilis TaxID=658062 RepID=A0A932EQN4_9BACT|nr:FixH family protein [Candidatus Koribacter versatilis]
MRQLFPFIVVLALAGCDQGPKMKFETRLEGAKPKAIIAERVQGQSPWRVALALYPEEPRANHDTRFNIYVDDGRHEPLTGAQVNVSLVMPIMDMGKNEFTAKEAPPGDLPNHPIRGVYEGTGKFTMDDEWEVFVTVTKDGKKGTHVFNVRVAE